jgi:hypothetical protein
MYKMMWEYFFPEEEQDSQRRQVSVNCQFSQGKKDNLLKMLRLMLHFLSCRKFGRFQQLLVQNVLRKAHRATKLLLHAVIQQKSLMSHPK